MDGARRGVVDVLMSCRELIAAGFRSPELLHLTLARTSPETRAVLSRFMAALHRVLQRCDRVAARVAGDKSPKGTLSAVSQFREAIIGNRPAPPSPTALEVFPSGGMTQGLIHGETRALQTFLKQHPVAHDFLVRCLIAAEPPHCNHSDSGTESTDGSDSDPDMETPVLEALLHANMLWVQHHPFDVVDAMSSRRAPPGGPQGPATSVEDRNRHLLACNLRLHHDPAAWEHLLAVRTAATEELTQVRDEAAQLEAKGGAEAMRTMAVRHLSQCIDALAFISINATPDDLRELLQAKLTQTLTSLTHIITEAGMSLDVAAPDAAQRRRSLLSRFSGPSKAEESAAAAVATQVRAAVASIKRHIRTVMAGPPT